MAGGKYIWDECFYSPGKEITSIPVYIPTGLIKIIVGLRFCSFPKYSQQEWLTALMRGHGSACVWLYNAVGVLNWLKFQSASDRKELWNDAWLIGGRVRRVVPTATRGSPAGRRQMLARLRTGGPMC